MSLDDGLLVKTWATAPRWSADNSAAYLAGVWRRVEVLLDAAKDRAGILGVTLELEDAIVLVREVWTGYAGAFVFGASTPLGLARVCINHELPQLRQSIWQLDPASVPG